MAGRTVDAVMMTAGRNEEQEVMTVAGSTVQAVMMGAGRNEEQEVRTVAGRTVPGSEDGGRQK